MDLSRYAHPRSNIPRLDIGRNTATYIIKDFFEDTPYVTAYDVENVEFSRSVIDGLIWKALVSKYREASVRAEGERYHHRERTDDYSGTHDGGLLSLRR